MYMFLLRELLNELLIEFFSSFSFFFRWIVSRRFKNLFIVWFIVLCFVSNSLFIIFGLCLSCFVLNFFFVELCMMLCYICSRSFRYTKNIDVCIMVWYRFSVFLWVVSSVWCMWFLLFFKYLLCLWFCVWW